MAVVTITGLPASAPKLSTVALVGAGKPFMKDQDPEVYQAIEPAAGGVRKCFKLSDGSQTNLADGAAVIVLQFDSAGLSPA